MMFRIIELESGRVCAETDATVLLPSEVLNQRKYRIETTPDGEPEGTRVFLDGNQWCAVRGDFTNLAVSLAGFGDYPSSALADLEQAELDEALDAAINNRAAIAATPDAREGAGE